LIEVYVVEGRADLEIQRGSAEHRSEFVAAEKGGWITYSTVAMGNASKSRPDNPVLVGSYQRLSISIESGPQICMEKGPALIQAGTTALAPAQLVRVAQPGRAAVS